MKPAAFDYLRADSIDEALECLAQLGDDARVIAGGQSLMPMLNMRLAKPEVLIDISALGELDYIKIERGMIEVGAAVTQAQLANWPELPKQAPLLQAAISHVGHFQTRNRGTVCGSLCHADPSSELPLCLATLGGEVVLASIKGKRTLSASEFQIGMLSTAKRADEMMIAARYPTNQAHTGYAFDEFARRHGDFAIVAAAAVTLGDKIRLGIGGVADRPQVLELDNPNGNSLDDALNTFAWELGGSDDIHATARYRRELVRRLGKQTLQDAIACRA
ncbi:MAG: FAD binding domain-containing protein [Gammaproteobacteria bacterium]|nr:FAD binding domain-containing protein [Gammaproteobacteria bacterium]